MKDFNLGQIALKILISLVLGALGTEIINVISGDPNHYSTPDKSSFYTLIIGIVIFPLLTFFSSNKKKT